MGVGSPGAPRKGKRVEAGARSKSGLVKEGAGQAWVSLLGLTRPPGGFQGGSLGKEGKVVSTVTARPACIKVSSGKPRAPCLATSCHTHTRHTAISATPALLTQPLATPIPLLSYFPTQLLLLSDFRSHPLPSRVSHWVLNHHYHPYHSRLLFPKMAPAVSLITHALLAVTLTPLPWSRASGGPLPLRLSSPLCNNCLDQQTRWM